MRQKAKGLQGASLKGGRPTRVRSEQAKLGEIAKSRRKCPLSSQLTHMRGKIQRLGSYSKPRSTR